MRPYLVGVLGKHRPDGGIAFHRQVRLVERLQLASTQTQDRRSRRPERPDRLRMRQEATESPQVSGRAAYLCEREK